jgi:ribonuclease HI
MIKRKEKPARRRPKSDRDITIFCDGACEPRNPGGTAAWGFVIYQGNERVEWGSGVVGSGPGMSNNVAEYSGLCAALAAALKRPVESANIAVKSDSMLLVKQMGGRWRVKGGMYVKEFERACRLENELAMKGNVVTFTWIPREQNQEADDLSKAHVPTRNAAVA